MIEGTTSTGFCYQLNEKKLGDWRFTKKLTKLKKFQDADNRDGIELEFITVMTEIEEFIFDDQGEALEEHVASLNDGLVPADILLQELLSVLQSNSETKN